MKFFPLCVLVVCFISPIDSYAQEIAIIDQGFNARFSHSSSNKFRPQWCFSLPDSNIPGAEPLFSLCPNNTARDFSSNSARFSGKQVFNGTNYTIQGNYFHGNAVGRAAWSFSQAVHQKHIQTGSVIFLGGTGPMQGSISSDNVLAALEKLGNEANQTSVSAVNMSLQISAANGLPTFCVQKRGQAAVNSLSNAGIPVVTGLLNRNISATHKTWPACLDNVINVGAATAGTTSGLGLGIGSNDITFYADDTISTPSSWNGQYAQGSSLAAPRVAAAYALLDKDFPNTTVGQKTFALTQASSKTANYNANGVSYRRRHIEKSHIRKALEILAVTSAGQLPGTVDGGVLAYEDVSTYGSYYGLEDSSYEFEIVYGESTAASKSLAVLAQAAMSMPTRKRDVILNFSGIVSGNSANLFDIYVNNILVDQTSYQITSSGLLNHSLILNRNHFSQNVNTIRIEPLLATSSSRSWGITDISAVFTPAVALTVGQTNTNVFGYSQTPSRYTGLRASFNIGNLASDYTLSVTGWDIDVVDETQVFINGVSLGHLSLSPNNGYNSGDTFILRKANLVVGQNTVEFVQRYPGVGWAGFHNTKWAVRNILVASAPADLNISSMSITDRSLSSNIPFTVSTSISNVGNGNSDTATLNFYVSSDESITTSDTLIHSESFAVLAPNSTRIVNTSVQTSLVNRGYFLGACVTAVASESNSANNCSAGVKLKSNVNVAPMIMLLLDEED